MKNTKSFQERFERWKNGESYWDIIGKPFNKKETSQFSQEEKNYLDSFVAQYRDGKDKITNEDNTEYGFDDGKGAFYGLRKNAYDNVSPNRYTDFQRRFALGAVLNRDVDSLQASGYDKDRDDQFAQYLRIPQDQRHRFAGRRSLQPPKYFPINKEDIPIFRMQLTDEEQQALIKDVKNKDLQFGQERTSNVLDRLFGDHTVGRGVNEKRGEYVSYYDRYDINPFQGADTQKSVTGFSFIDALLRKYNGDYGKILGAQPFGIYDRMYLDDYYGVDSSADPGDYYGGYLPEVIITPTKHTLNKQRNKIKH